VWNRAMLEAIKTQGDVNPKHFRGKEKIVIGWI
jgi:hypothetical protein